MRRFLMIILMSHSLAMPSYSFNCGKYLMEKAVLDIRVVIKDGQRRLKIFTESTAVGRFLNTVSGLFKNTLGLENLKNAIYRLQRNLKKMDGPYFAKLSQAFRLKAKITKGNFDNVPKDKPVIFYANHPLSGIDAFLMMKEIEQVRPDTKVIAASFLESIPGFAENAYIVNVLKTPEAREYNQEMIKIINQHVKEGKSLLIFPAGSVSRWDEGARTYAMDPEWKKGFIKFGEQSEETTYIPLFVEGEPSEAYLKTREKNVTLSNALIFKELSNQINSTVRFQVGEGIRLSDLHYFSYEEKISYLRAKLYDQGTEYFLKNKGEQAKISDQYSIEAPMVKKDEYYTMKWIDSELNK